MGELSSPSIPFVLNLTRSPERRCAEIHAIPIDSRVDQFTVLLRWHFQVGHDALGGRLAGAFDDDVAVFTEGGSIPKRGEDEG